MSLELQVSERQSDELTIENRDSNNRTLERSGPADTKDGLRSWVMCSVALVVSFAIYGLYFSYGLFFVEFLAEFEQSEAKTAWVGSLATTMHFICYVICGFLMHYINTQTITIVGAAFMAIGLGLTSLVNSLELMFLTYGILYGMGTGLAFGHVMASVPYYFESRKALVVGLLASSSSLGQILYPQFITFLLQRFPWRQVFKIVLFAPVCALISSFTFKKRDLSVRTTVKKLKQDYLAFLKDKQFLCWSFGSSIIVATMWVPLQFLVLYCKSLGYSTDDGSLLLTYLGIASMSGELMTGFLMDYIKSIPKIYIFIFYTVLSALVDTQVAFAYSYWCLVVYACVFGFLVGAVRSLGVIVTMEFVGQENFRSAYGIYNFIMSCFMMAGPPAAGFLYDTFLSYTPVFLMCAIIYVTSLVILVPLAIVRARTRRTNTRRQTQSRGDTNTDTESSQNV